MLNNFFGVATPDEEKSSGKSPHIYEDDDNTSEEVLSSSLLFISENFFCINLRMHKIVKQISKITSFQCNSQMRIKEWKLVMGRKQKVM